MKKIIPYFLVLHKSKGLQQTIITFSGNIVASGLSGVALILISRLLEPYLFGQFSIAFAFAMIVTRINDFGFTAALQKFAGQSYKDSQLQSQYYSIATTYKLIISAALILASFIFIPYLTTLLRLESSLLLYIALIGSFCMTYFENLSAILYVLHRFVSIAVLTVLQSLVKLGIALGVVLMEYKQLPTILTLYLLAPAVTLLTTRWVLPDIRYQFLLRQGQLQKHLTGMAKFVGISYIITNLSDQIAIFFVQAFLTTYDTGIIGGVSKIELLFSVLAMSLTNVFVSRVVRYDSAQEKRQFIIKSSITVLAMIFGIFLAILGARYLITYTVGTSYVSGISLLRLLLIGSGLQLLTIPFTALLYTANKPSFFTVSAVLQLIATLLANVVLLPIFGLNGAGITKILVKLAGLFIAVIYCVWIFRRKAQV